MVSKKNDNLSPSGNERGQNRLEGEQFERRDPIKLSDRIC